MIDKVIFLGTGPNRILGQEDKDRRLDTSILIGGEDKFVLVGCSPYIEEQLGKFDVSPASIRGILLPDSSSESIRGLPKFRQLFEVLPEVYATNGVIEAVRDKNWNLDGFNFVGIYPNVRFDIGGIVVLPIDVKTSMAFIFDDKVGYAPKVGGIEQENWDDFSNLELLIIDCKNYFDSKSKGRLNPEFASNYIDLFEPKKTYLIGMGTTFPDFDKADREIKDFFEDFTVELSYDGLEVDLNNILTKSNDWYEGYIQSFLEKQRGEGLVPKKVQVHREGKTFEATRWVRPEEVSNYPDISNKSAWNNILKPIIENSVEPEKTKEMFNFIMDYISIADPNIKVADDKIKKISNGLIPRVKRVRDEIKRWRGLSDKSTYIRKINKALEYLESDDRVYRVIGIDSIIHMTHFNTPTLIPDLFDIPDRLSIGKKVVSILDFLAEDESKMEKSFLEIRKENRQGLVPKKVQVHREGKTFESTRWVRPQEAVTSAFKPWWNDPIKERAGSELSKLVRNKEVGEAKNARKVEKLCDFMLKDIKVEPKLALESSGRYSISHILGFPVRVMWALSNGNNMHGKKNEAANFWNFLQGYIDIANPEKRISDNQLDSIQDLLVKQFTKWAERHEDEMPEKPPEDEWMARRRVVQLNLKKLGDEIKKANTRLDKILAIDALVAFHHQYESTAIPQLFDMGNSTVLNIEVVSPIFNYLASEEQKMEKSFIEIRKENRQGLVPKKVLVHREGKIFERTQMVRPEETKPERKVRITPHVWERAPRTGFKAIKTGVKELHDKDLPKELWYFQIAGDGYLVGRGNTIKTVLSAQMIPSGVQVR